MSVRVAGPRGCDRDARSDGVDERLRRRRLAPVVRDLEQVEPREARCEERRVDGLLDVTGQQEPELADGAEQHDRHVVDAGPTIGRLSRDPAADRPEDVEVDLVHGQRVACGELGPDRGTG
jgi:hypothetical protein